MSIKLKFFSSASKHLGKLTPWIKSEVTNLGVTLDSVPHYHGDENIYLFFTLAKEGPVINQKDLERLFFQAVTHLFTGLLTGLLFMSFSMTGSCKKHRADAS